MSQQNPWQAKRTSERLQAWQHDAHMGADDSSTFVNPVHEESSHSYSPYGFSSETTTPPPPPGINAPFFPQSKRNTGYLIALVVLSVLVVVLGSLEILQVAAQTRAFHIPLCLLDRIKQAAYQSGTQPHL